MRILLALSVCHLLNDLLQALLPALYPILKDEFHLSFTQIGLLTLTNQVTASVLQPAVGTYTDRRPQPYSLVFGMTMTLSGVLMLALAHRFGLLLLAAALVGVGSSIFHPESSRLARVASGGRHGFAQSLFQTGGNFGSSLGPLLAAFIVVPRGQGSIAWFSICALVALVLMWRIGRWYAHLHLRTAAHTGPVAVPPMTPAAKRTVAVLLALVFSKYVYLMSLSSYFMFFLIDRFQISVDSAQLYLFAFLAAVAAGTFAGGPIGDRFGRKYVIWGSILGVLPFTLALPHASLFWTACLSVIIGLVLASAFSAILVYAQELLPGRVGFVAGLFFGFAFGIAGLGAAVLGKLADWYGIATVYHVCAFLPVIGLLAVFLPDQPHHAHA
ncbi:MAG TPA: MFS transporter [Vicinamibacterales bacterium]|nr:MFS transporter [Vicinamibacterales bacterium]